MVEEIKVTDTFIREMERYRMPNKDLSPIGACSENVVFFAEYMLGMRLYSWQVYFLKDIQDAINGKTDQREFIALTSRQIGKSTALAIFSLWAAVFNKYPGGLGGSTVVGIASASDGQAKKLLNEMKKMLRLGDRHMSEYLKDDDTSKYGSHFFTDLLDEHEPNNTTTMTFQPSCTKFGDILLKGSKSGSVIKSYPPTAGVLGETFSIVIIDEAGKSEKITDQFFYDYMYPTGNSTDAIRVYTSTPWLSSGFFYRLVNPDNMYSEANVLKCLFSIEAIHLEDEKYYTSVMKIVDQLNGDGKVDEVQRAYYCRFVKGEQAYFIPDDVHKMFVNDYEEYSSYMGLCDMGVDFGGQTTSKTVITITEMTEQGLIRRLYKRVYPVSEDNNLVQDIEDLMKRFNIQRVIPDDCPQGDYLIRQMEEKGWDVQPMNFRADKVKKYGAFRSSLHKKMIVSFMDDDLRTEMLAMEFNKGARQSVIQHAPGYSDDEIDSFVMSCYFFVQEEGGVKTFDWYEEEA